MKTNPFFFTESLDSDVHEDSKVAILAQKKREPTAKTIDSLDNVHLRDTITRSNIPRTPRAKSTALKNFGENQMSHSSHEAISHYTRIPNILLKKGLRPSVLSTYLAILRAAGTNGVCVKSIFSLCEDSGLSANTIRKCKKILEKDGLILITPRRDEIMGHRPDRIEIVDLWQENREHFQSLKRRTPPPSKSQFTPPHPPSTSRLKIASTQGLKDEVIHIEPPPSNLESNKYSSNLIPMKLIKQQQQPPAQAPARTYARSAPYRDACASVSAALGRRSAAVFFLRYEEERIASPSVAPALTPQTPKRCPMLPQAPLDPASVALLKEIDISEEDKKWICMKYSADAIRNAIEWATAPQTKVTTTMVQAIKWACRERPQIAKSKEERKKEAVVGVKERLKGLDGLTSGRAREVRLELLSSGAEIVYGASQKPSFFLSYDTNGFIEQLSNQMRKDFFREEDIKKITR